MRMIVSDVIDRLSMENPPLLTGDMIGLEKLRP
jgi:hypothetical protein